MDPTGTEEQETERKKNPFFNWLVEFLYKFWKKLHDPRFVIEVLALIGLVFYVCETKRTNNLTQQALTNARKNFAKDQRPYVWPARIEAAPLKLKEKVSANIYFINYGKTPAIKEHSTGKILVFYNKTIVEQIDNFFETFDETKVAGGSEIIVPPGIPTDPKQSQSFATTYSDVIPTTQAAMDLVTKTDGSFAVVGVVTYFDSDGTHYRSDYCMMHLANGLLAWCEKHNAIR